MTRPAIRFQDDDDRACLLHAPYCEQEKIMLVVESGETAIKSGTELSVEQMSCDAASRKARYLAGMRKAEGGFIAAAQAFIEMEQAGDDISFVRSGLRQVLRAIG